MLFRFGIPVKHAGVNVFGLHPDVRGRVRRALNDLLDGDGRPRCRLASGARTYAQQAELRRRYLSGRGNLAADPDRVLANGRVGSAHQVQTAGRYEHGNLSNGDDWAYAVDVGFWGSPSGDDIGKLEAAMRAHGMVATVPGEWWHFEPTRNGQAVGLMGEGSTGVFVEALQQHLGAAAPDGAAFYAGPVDGVWGAVLSSSVREWQRVVGRPAHGDWTVADQARFDAWVSTDAKPLPSLSGRVDRLESRVSALEAG